MLAEERRLCGLTPTVTHSTDRQMHAWMDRWIKGDSMTMLCTLNIRLRAHPYVVILMLPFRGVSAAIIAVVESEDV